MAHTPGPWRAVRNPYRDDGYFVLAGEGRGEQTVSAMIASQSLSQGQFYSEADARLIAAAPDLLAALKALSARHAWGPEGIGHCICEAHAAAQAAIIKASPLPLEAQEQKG